MYSILYRVYFSRIERYDRLQRSLVGWAGGVNVGLARVKKNLPFTLDRIKPLTKLIWWPGKKKTII